MRAIPTEYKGIIFRSRLEAGWAAYFDELALTWSYEPEGYALRNGINYLPDFHISQNYYEPRDFFVECKPPSKDSIRKGGYFVSEARKALLVAMPEGRFFLCTPKYARCLIENDWRAIEFYQKTKSSLAMVSDDADGGPHNYFWNGGEESDLYTGFPPDYFNAISDKGRRNGGDARCYYFGGHSTWGQRDFKPPRWMPK